MPPFIRSDNERLARFPAIRYDRRMPRSGIRLLSFLAVILLPDAVSAGRYADCLAERVLTEDGTTTISELRAACGAPELPRETDQAGRPSNALSWGAVDNRLSLESEVSRNPFVLLAHRPNYFLFASYNSRINDAPFETAGGRLAGNLQPTEAKFQLSLKVPITRDLFGSGGDLYFAYTNRSFWQLYNTEHSSPFRETNHEPEVWLSFDTDHELAGWRMRLLHLGLSHQSNGRAGSLSRSWNRLYGRIVFERGNKALAIQPWLRIPEPRSEDDNPDITKYLGHFELLAVIRNGRTTFSLKLRNNLDFRHNRGAVQADWSFPIRGHARGYLQWFNGYGESLIDYNAITNSIGIGISVSDWM